jgi:tetratricopeptide (TPR) repeat protein
VGGASREAWLPLAPALLFVALAIALGCFTPGAAGPAAWLERAGSVQTQLRERGASLPAILDPVEDPRVGPAALAMRVGLPAGATRLLARLAALLAGLCALAVIMKRSATGSGGRWISAFMLAASPIWLRAVLEGDPGVLLGLAVLLIGDGLLPAWLSGIALAWALGWSPWAWVTLLPIALARCLDPRVERRGAIAAVAIGVLLFACLNPPGLLHPVRWLEAMRWAGRLSSLGVGRTSFAVATGLWPLLGSLHVAGAMLLVPAALHWPRRMRAGDLRPLVFVASLLLALPSGFASATPILIVLPWAAREAGGGAQQLLVWARLGSRAGRIGRTALVLITLVPLLAVSLGSARRLAAREPLNERVDAWLRDVAPAGALIAHDMGFAPPTSTPLRYLSIPFHAIDPASEAGAYWTGWYAACDAIVISEKLVLRFARSPQSFPEVERFYLDLRARAREDHLFGTEPGSRLRVILQKAADAKGSLGDGWRERVRRGAGSGLTGGFLASLGGQLVQGGRGVAAAELLDEALASGYTEVGIYLNLANAELALERPMEAGRVLDEALGRYPDSPEVQYNLGRVLVRVGYWDRAVAVLTRLRAQWPQSAAVAYLLASALVQTGYTKSATELFEEALTLNPTAAEREAAQRQLAALRGQAP